MAQLPIIAMVMLAILIPYNINKNTYAQKDNSSSDIPGNVVNSKYLSITNHRYRQGEFGDTVTGTIVNNSTQDVGFASVYAALYDRDNVLITMESGSVSVSSLKAGDDSPFTINVFGVKDIDHYTLFPAGTPS